MILNDFFIIGSPFEITSDIIEFTQYYIENQLYINEHSGMKDLKYAIGHRSLVHLTDSYCRTLWTKGGYFFTLPAISITKATDL